MFKGSWFFLESSGVSRPQSLCDSCSLLLGWSLCPALLGDRARNKILKDEMHHGLIMILPTHIQEHVFFFLLNFISLLHPYLLHLYRFCPVPKILVLNYTNITTYLLNVIIHSHSIKTPTLPPKQFKVVTFLGWVREVWIHSL